MKRTHSFMYIIILLALLAAACKAPAPDSTSEADPYAVFTAAALTAEAKGQQTIATTPPATPLPATSTPEGETAATPASTSEPSEGKDAAEFVRDITIPDGTEVPPNGPFVKTWLLKNTGTTTWTTDYSLAFVGGDRMEAPELVPLPGNVPPNETVEISVELIAPGSPAHYTAYFNLRNTSGVDFGVGVSAIEAFWADIVVSDTAAPLPTATPDASADYVTEVFLYVDNTSANQCPHTFNYTAKISLSNPATVTYMLEAGASNPGFQIDLPEPVTAELGAGTHTINYNLTFSSAINGWVILHVTSPGDHFSNTVNIILNCQ